jgi:hypothetical protein
VRACVREVVFDLRPPSASHPNALETPTIAVTASTRAGMPRFALSRSPSLAPHKENPRCEIRAIGSGS